MDEKEVIEILKEIRDPDYPNKSIVDMELVGEGDIKITDDAIEVSYTLTAPMCPFSAAIGTMIKHVLETRLKKKIRVKLKAHYQSGVVNEILGSEERRRELLDLLKSTGMIKRFYGGRAENERPHDL
ncbi:MAG: iron-sulfur cluster assembly protein [Candidatus Hadarchaeota archaeon]